ncbi:MAG: Wzz/FepE/Etk N-terminal domain-containing protein, partial [Deltaproteobacteria bacterium]
LEILRRRWWVVLIPSIVVCAGVFAASLFVRNRYTSTTLMLVEGQKVPEDYVKATVTGDIADRLGTIQEQILSRTRLQPLVEKYGLYAGSNGEAAMEDRVDMARKALEISPVQAMITRGRDTLPGFTIQFTADKPQLAQQICSDITSMFIEEDLRLREQTATGTTKFLRDQLDDAKRRLDEQDARLADFKRKFMGSLPGNEQTDMNMLNAFTSRLDAVTSELTRAQQEKTYAESLLAQNISAWQDSHTNPGVNQDKLEQELQSKQAGLVALKAQYTDDYPDVVKLKADIAALQKKIADSDATQQTKPATESAATNRPEPTQIQQLRLQIHQIGVTIKQKTEEQARLKQQIGSYQSRLSMSPAVEEEFKAITRDHETALKFYNDLLAKMDQSEMAVDLERQQQGQQFRIMDPADLPQKPSFPNRPFFAGAGLGAGIALGLGITLILEYRDRSLRSEGDVEAFLHLPTLAMVPTIESAKGR